MKDQLLIFRLKVSKISRESCCVADLKVQKLLINTTTGGRKMSALSQINDLSSSFARGMCLREKGRKRGREEGEWEPEPGKREKTKTLSCLRPRGTRKRKREENEPLETERRKKREAVEDPAEVSFSGCRQPEKHNSVGEKIEAAKVIQFWLETALLREEPPSGSWFAPCGARG